MMDVAQLDPTTVINTAANQGWAFGALCLIMAAAILGLAWLMKVQLTQAGLRENRMALRIDKLEENQSAVLITMVKDSQGVISKFTETLDKAITELEKAIKELEDRPCYWEEEKRKHQEAAL
jgi:hypothetical protein